jgi:V8-like Glu-specific endopeptidase
MHLRAMPVEDVQVLGPKLATAGFPGDHDQNILWGVRNCRFRESGFGAMWMHDCSITPGSSGSPIFYRDAEAQVHVVAIASAAAQAAKAVLSDYDSAYANSAVPIDRIYDRIRPYIEMDTGPRPQPRY